MDNLETRDERRVLRRTCFSIERASTCRNKNCGYRSEINVFVDGEGMVHVTGRTAATGDCGGDGIG